MTEMYPCASKPAGFVNAATVLADAGRTSRIRYKAGFGFKNVRLKYVNDWARQAGNPATPATITIKASVDTAADGSGLTRVTFDGGKTSKALATGEWCLSDPVPVAVARDAFFWVSTNVVPSGGTQYPGQSQGVANIYATNYASRFDDLVTVNTATDYSMTVPASWPASSSPDPFAVPSNASAWGPFAIYGEVAQGEKRSKSVVILGDSISVGFSDDLANPAEDGANANTTYNALSGWQGRSLEQEVPWVHTGFAGATLQAFNTRSFPEYREARTSGCDFAIVNLGVNDAASRSVAQMKADFLALVADLAAQHEKVYVSKISPLSTGTYTTEAGQTQAAAGVKTQQVNTWLAGKPFAASNVVIVDLWADTRYIKADGTEVWRANHTADGTHPNGSGHAKAAQVARALFRD